MADYKRLYMQYMDQEGIKYTETGEFRVRVVYNTDNLPSVPVSVIFDKDGEDMVQFYCYEIAKVPAEKRQAVINACNFLNNKFRWVKFSVDDDNDIVAQIDAYIDELTCGQECRRLVNRVVSIVDDAYPDLMKALWS